MRAPYEVCPLCGTRAKRACALCRGVGTIVRGRLRRLLRAGLRAERAKRRT
jgi:hypothetical protein